ncbi:hypothetical protein TNCV_1603771 [Trichonephila clavipes]|nr:hypothetical protein TNCV_1603761 [Trichonephila clavipes]GFW19483.1 hypothetical protein TNCV_1603771 [Trichonephila clavipes]
MLNTYYQKLGRDSILKRLAGAKWGCGRATLNITFKTYVHPVLKYYNEALISASDSVLEMLKVFENQALRLITGGVKTSPLLSKHLLVSPTVID